MRCALGLPSGGFKKKDIYVAEQFLKCLRKTQVRLPKSDLGLPWAVAAVLTWLQSDTSQSRAQTITLPQILPPPWQSLKSIITCEIVFLTVFASRIHLATRKHRWIFHGFVYYDATNVNFTENPLTSPEFEQTESLLSQWHLPWFQNALQCTIFHLTDVPGFHEEKFYFAARKTEWDNVAYASMHPFSVIQSSTLALTPLPDSSNHVFSLFSFSLCFSVFSRGAKVSCAMNYNSVGQ